MNKKGFTLIELLAVIVILAIIALIATPIVLGIINDARENSRKRSMDNIIHAAELYYMQGQMNGSSFNKIDFDLSDENNGLEYEGERPEGILTIYPGGKIYINAKFDDGSSYTKYPNETTPVKDKKVIGDYSLWQVDSNGRLTKYKGDSTVNPAVLATQNFIMYVMYSGMYATEDRVDENGNTIEEFNKSLKENLAVLENSGEISRTNIPLSLNKELDILIEILDVDHQLTETDTNALMTEYADKIPYAMDVIINLESYGENVFAYKAYNIIAENVEDEPLIIPNYVKQKDGTIQKVTSIAMTTFVTETLNNPGSVIPVYDYKCSLEEAMVSVIISEGIEKIESRAFQECNLTGITFPNTLKTIGKYAFIFNVLGEIRLPYSLEEIGESAFLSLSGIKGDLKIPPNVRIIGADAFGGSLPVECDKNSEDYETCTLLEQSINNIYNITFEKGSKIESIGEEAFKGNPITTLTIPKTIKTIGKKAFDTTTLKSVIIERAEGDDLSIGENAFGNATVEYRP